MIETIKCNCGVCVEYDNPTKGCTNIGHFQTATGWRVIWNTFDSKMIPLCPVCTSEARQLAARLKAVCGTACVNPHTILG